jgi:F-box domain
MTCHEISRQSAVTSLRTSPAWDRRASSGVAAEGCGDGGGRQHGEAQRPWAALPRDCLLHVARRSSATAAARMRRVCRGWRAAARPCMAACLAMCSDEASTNRDEAFIHSGNSGPRERAPHAARLLPPLLAAHPVLLTVHLDGAAVDAYALRCLAHAGRLRALGLTGCWFEVCSLRRADARRSAGRIMMSESHARRLYAPVCCLSQSPQPAS